MKKKRKQHNPDKRAQRFFNNTRLWSWESMIDQSGSRISHGEARCGFVWKPLSQKEVDSLIRRNNNWVICCRALCVAGDKEWIESEIRSARDIKVNDFSFMYDELRDAVLSQVQKRHVIDVGWIVNSFGKNDRIDSNFELAYQKTDLLLEQRQKQWRILDETYKERRAIELEAEQAA